MLVIKDDHHHGGAASTPWPTLSSARSAPVLYGLASIRVRGYTGDSMPPAHARRTKKTATSSRAARPPKTSPGSDSPLVDVVLVPGTHVKRLALDIGRLIQSARQQVAQTANAALTALYWAISTRIHQDMLKVRRAEYGAHIVSAVGRELEALYGRGFGEKSLWHMVRVAEVFPDGEIVSALRRQLAWTHFKQIIYIDDPLKREFYAEMCRAEGWSIRTLEQKIACSSSAPRSRRSPRGSSKKNFRRFEKATPCRPISCSKIPTCSISPTSEP